MRRVRARVLDDRHFELSVRLRARPGRTIAVGGPEKALGDGVEPAVRPRRPRDLPGFGSWKHRRDIRDGAQWVRSQRKGRAARTRG